jgi:hypothetical protein
MTDQLAPLGQEELLAGLDGQADVVQRVKRASPELQAQEVISGQRESRDIRVIQAQRALLGEQGLLV